MNTELMLFVTIAGAEVIGRVVERNLEQNTITLEQPLVIRPMQRGESVVLDLFPHSLVDAEGQHVFNLNTVMSFAVKVPANLEKAYLERTSKIILAGQLDRLEMM
jgi:hypothetical protein